MKNSLATHPLLVFDLLDTVVVDPFFARLPHLFGLPMASVMACLDPAVWRAFELGQIDEPTYLRTMFSAQGRAQHIAPHAVRDTIVQSYAFVPGMEALLLNLKQRGLHLWALSNYSPWGHLLLDALDLARFFEGWAFSFELGARKPETRAYQGLCRRARVFCADCLMIDDREENIRGARTAGMQGVVFENASQLEKNLEAALGLRLR